MRPLESCEDTVHNGGDTCTLTHTLMGWDDRGDLEEYFQGNKTEEILPFFSMRGSSDCVGLTG